MGARFPGGHKLIAACRPCFDRACPEPALADTLCAGCLPRIFAGVDRSNRRQVQSTEVDRRDPLGVFIAHDIACDIHAQQ